ncbi:MAG: hypothetical protein A3B68_09700 [Candidatus Melainabacteria bacterium RIFCSPHIGHO2_02_FULL_34_12]|nr:MAG: hypothetical protein A3B68_09700 [Candidatus Melainabacteria bacterium RIFCSPHIGHO2_02_FULL_34_12]
MEILHEPEFFVLSVIALAGALGVILEANIIRAGFSLVICFGAISGTYFALSAPFIGASQILIYAVGITLVIVFALMLTSLKHGLPKIEGEAGKNILSALIAIGIFITFSITLTGANKWQINDLLPCPKNTEVIGLKLLGSYALPFELISVLLLVALIGAIVIAKRDKKNV